MHARINIIFGQKDKVDAGVSHLEESDRAVVETAAGNRGLTTMVDREAGVIMAVSYWDEPIRSSQDTLTRAREAATEAAGGDLVAETYEVVARENRADLSAGAPVRVGRIQIDPTAAGDARQFIQEGVLSDLRDSAGLDGAELLVGPDAGLGMLILTWTSEDAAARGDAVLGQLRDEAASRRGTKLTRIERYTLVNASTPA
jgi:hypothetical protein